MPSHTIEDTHIDSNVQIVDERTGHMITVDAQSAFDQLEKHAPGIMIPGIGQVGGVNQQRTQQQRPQHPQQSQYKTAPPQYNTQSVQYTQQAPPTSTMQIPVQQGTSQFPNIEVVTLYDSYHMFMDLAGVKKSTLGITFSNGFLTINGIRESNIEILKKSLTLNTTTSRKNPILKKLDTIPKFLMGSFTFEYPFEKMIDESAISASLDDGILHVTLPHRSKGEAVTILLG